MRSPNRKLRIGLVGLGGVSRFYLDAFQHVKGMQLLVVCDIDEKRLSDVAERRRNVGRTRLVNDLRAYSLDAVIVDVPASAHFDVCNELLQFTSVCCEKPLVLSLSDADLLIARSHSNKRLLMTAFHRRYNSNLRSTVPQHTITAVDAWYEEDIRDHAGDATWYFRSHEEGGGVLHDNGPNAYDAARVVAGPMTMHSSRLTIVDGAVMQAHVRGTTAFGAPFTVSLDWQAPIERKGMRIATADGTEQVIDFLEGYDDFKSSLSHEYVGALMDLETRLRRGAETNDDEERAGVSFVEDAYALASAAATSNTEATGRD